MSDLPPLQRREPIGVLTRGNRVEPSPSFVRYLESLTRNQNTVTRTVQIIPQPVEAPVAAVALPDPFPVTQAVALPDVTSMEFDPV